MPRRHTLNTRQQSALLDLPTDEIIPLAVPAWLGAQLGIAGDTLARYAIRRQPRQQHMEILRRTCGYRTFPGQGAPARAFRDWLLGQAEQARSNDDLARRFIARCRDTMIILPATDDFLRPHSKWRRQLRDQRDARLSPHAAYPRPAFQTAVRLRPCRHAGTTWPQPCARPASTRARRTTR